MPQVPGYENFGVQAEDFRLQRSPHLQNPITPSEAEIGAKQQQQLGSEVEKAGQTYATIDTDIQNRINEVRVNDATNQLQAAGQSLAYDPKTGFRNLTGADALNRPSGQALPEEYGGKLQEHASEISAKLGNAEQQRLFDMRAQDYHTRFTGEVESHMLDQYQTFQGSVAKGTAELGQQQAAQSWNNPAQVDTAINGFKGPDGKLYGGVRNAIADGLRQEGKSPEEIKAAQDKAESKIHEQVVETALENNQPSYAVDYFNKNKSKMDADGILAVQGKVTHQMNGWTTAQAVNAAATKFASGFNPSDFDRLKQSVLNRESAGGHDFKEDGVTPIVNPDSGARYAMQVMPSTAIAPGYGIKPAQDDSPAEYNRVGTEYLGKLVEKYGDPAKALAAYNAGPGNVDKAIADVKDGDPPGSWLGYLAKYQSAANHKQTVDYVTKSVNEFFTGSGAPPQPTKEQFVDEALKSLGDSPTPELKTMAREQAEKQFDIMETSRKEAADNALAQGQKELLAMQQKNGSANINELSPRVHSDIMRLDPAKWPELIKYAKSIGKGDQADNMDEFTDAITHPEKMAKMSDAEFENYNKTNFGAATQEKMVKLRAGVLNGTSSDDAQSINSKTLTSALNERLLNIGINPAAKTGNDKQRSSAALKFVTDDIFEQQRQLGRKMTPEEVENHIDNLFAKSVTLPGFFTNSTENMMSMKPGDVPSVARAKIVQAFASVGNQNPSDFDILRMYWRQQQKAPK